MDIELLKKLGNIDQIAGIRESQLLHGRGEGTRIAEFHNAAGLRFTVVPDRCMDLFDLSFKGVNFSFQSKNGLVSPFGFSPYDGEFCEQWSGGMMVTCGLDNVGDECKSDGNYPTHGRIGWVPAQNFGTSQYWNQDQYILRAEGETHHTKMYGRHLSIRRSIETTLESKSIRIHDTITNFETADEPYMLLYHFNFGFPLLQADSLVEASHSEVVTPMNELSTDSIHMMAPVDGRGEELYFRTGFGDRAFGMIYNKRLELGAYVSFDTANLPNLVQWKNMKSHDYVLALEPCNTFGIHRVDAAAQDKLAVLPAYSSIENDLEIGILDGLHEINGFLKQLN